MSNFDKIFNADGLSQDELEGYRNMFDQIEAKLGAARAVSVMAEVMYIHKINGNRDQCLTMENGYRKA